MVRKWVWAAALAAALSLTSAAAQDLDDQVTVVEELIARPLTPGPAWWKVSDADSAVYVLVNLERTPQGLAWDRSVLQRRLAQANRVFTPTDVSINPASFASALVMAAGLRDRRPVADRLSREGGRKYRRVVAQMGKRPDYYDGWVSIVAAQFLESDYFDHLKTSDRGVQRVVEEEARRYRLRTQRAGTIPVTQAKANKNQLVGDECLEVMVAKLEIRADALYEVAGAWARGDVRPILFPAPETKVPDACDEDKGTNFATLKRQVIAEQVRNFEQAMRTPGHAVALIDAEELLVKNGLLEQLKAKGYQVTTPNLIED